MSLCPACGCSLVGTTRTYCAHHDYPDETWAAVNRVMCALLHRGEVPRRLSAAERDETFYDPALEGVG